MRILNPFSGLSHRRIGGKQLRYELAAVIQKRENIVALELLATL
jgi:hypothetical protein